MKTFSQAGGGRRRSGSLIDAEGLVVGRLATRRRQPPARQAQADLHAARRLRRQRHRHQCREGGLHRQASVTDKVYYWHTGYPGGIKERTARQILEGKLPRARPRKGGRAHDPARPARPPADEATCASTRAPSTRTSRSSPRRSTSAQAEPQELEGLMTMAETQIPRRSRQPADRHAGSRRRRPVHVQKLDKQGRAYATGKRKNAIARVWIKPGKGKITVNDKDFTAYFARPVLQMLLQQPLIGGQPRRTSSTSSPRSSAAACPARPARCVTASRRRSPITSPSCAACSRRAAS